MENINKDLLMDFIDMIMGVIFLYGPIDENEILDIIEEKCQNRYELCYPLYGSILQQLTEKQIEKRDELYSLVPFSQLDELQAVIGVSREEIIQMLERKDFSGETIKSYADIFHPDHHNVMAELADFIAELDIDEDTKEEMYKTAVVCAINLSSIENFEDILSEQTGSLYDSERLEAIYDELVRIIPRGMFNGYSLAELGMKEREETEEKRIVPFDKREYPHFTYQQCLKLAEEVKNTDLFENISSNSLIQLYINNSFVYCFVLGYFYGEKAVLIMDEENVRYSSYLMRNGESYPDLIYRVSQIEVLLEEPEMFAEALKTELQESGYPDEPLFVSLKSMKVMQLADEKETDIIGAVLTELLRIAEDDSYDSIMDSDERVNQVYVYDDHIEYGNYNDYDFYDVVVPFETEKLSEENIETLLSCQQDAQITIGLYSSESYEEESESYMYMCYIVDSETAELIDVMIINPADIESVVNDVAEILIENDINPYSISFNNNFTFEVFRDFAEVCEDIEIDQLLTDQINDFFNTMLQNQQQDSVIN